jgi:hypothetical protein
MSRDEKTFTEPKSPTLLAISFSTHEHSILPAISDQINDSRDLLNGVVWTVKNRKFILPRLPT